MSLVLAFYARSTAREIRSYETDNSLDFQFSPTFAHFLEENIPPCLEKGTCQNCRPYRPLLEALIESSEGKFLTPQGVGRELRSLSYDIRHLSELSVQRRGEISRFVDLLSRKSYDIDEPNRRNIPYQLLKNDEYVLH